MTDEKGQDLEIADEKQTDILDKISLSTECNKALSVIKSMGEKCREILMLAADDLAYKEMAETIDTPIGTVMSRLANCRKELRGLMST
jgi:RNA polymerase sigma-70 factor (ECF subfamily)